MIVGLQHIGWAVADIEAFARDTERLFALRAVHASMIDAARTCRIDLPNDCWLQAVADGDPGSRVGRFLAAHGEGLDHAALETDDLDGDLARLEALGVRVLDEACPGAREGARAVLVEDDVLGFPVELVERVGARPAFGPVTNPNILGLQHIGVAVDDLERTAARFEALFGLRASGLRFDQHGGDQRDMMVQPGNDRLWFHLVETNVPDHRMFRFRQRHGPGLEHLCVEFGDIRRGVRQVQEAGVVLERNKIYLDREDGFEAFVMPPDNHGVTLELIEPYPTSRGYRDGSPYPLQ